MCRWIQRIGLCGEPCGADEETTTEGEQQNSSEGKIKWHKERLELYKKAKEKEEERAAEARKAEKEEKKMQLKIVKDVEFWYFNYPPDRDNWCGDFGTAQGPKHFKQWTEQRKEEERRAKQFRGLYPLLSPKELEELEELEGGPKEILPSADNT
eukprot:5255911-Pyramimonas_sp.AAC.1